MAFLRSRDYRILATNYSCKKGELDVVAMQGRELVFVEVRSRASDAYGSAAETVDQRKQRQVARVAQVYISSEAPDFDSARFDVIGVTGGELEHIVDAFRADGAL